MKLGTIQKAWIKSLRENPERQTKSRLVKKTENGYKACCLGELLITECRLSDKPFPFNDITDEIFDEHKINYTGELHKDYKVLSGSRERFGLFSRAGEFKDNKKVSINGTIFSCLSEMNDGELTWVEIADFVEKNPDLVFSKSV